MQMNRRSFLASGITTVAGTIAVNGAPAQTLAQEPTPISPFTDADFGFAAQISLGHSYYRAGEPGKLLAIVSKIKTGDFESAWAAYHQAGVELRTLAESAAAKRHNVSAREAYLAATSYFSSAP
jgi:hypothetical protein